MATATDDSDLRDPLQRGVEELNQKYPRRNIEVTATAGNWVAISLGAFSVAEYDARPDYDEVEMFVRVPKTFPNGNCKGFGTSPPLETVLQGNVNQNPSWDPEVQSAVQNHRDADVEFYSWTWAGVQPRNAEDLVTAMDLAKRLLKEA